MERQFKQLVRLFSDNEDIPINFIESWESMEISTSIILHKIPDLNTLLTPISFISARDLWEIKIIDESESTILNIHSASEKLDNINEIKAYKESTVSIKFIITKEIKNSKLSIYSICRFSEYLRDSSLFTFFNILNKRLKQILILECINDKIEPLNTESISVVYKDDKSELVGLCDKVKRIHLIEGLIHWGAYKLQLLPEDIYPSNSTNPLYNIFKQASACLLAMYLFDHAAISDNALNLKLCGFKSLSYTIDATKLSELNIDQDTIAQLYQVYEWGMSGGHVADKFSISRNILSLNLDTTQIIITSDIIDAIRSNFKVYEKENVQQYIQLRNELSTLLIDLQTKVNDIAQNFTTDFKNNLLVLVSFFASVIVFGVISEARPLAYFSNHIIILSYCFLLISFFYWLYSFNELKKKTKLFYKHYDQIKNRYSTLLVGAELKDIFEECHPDKYESRQSYIEWQKHWFSCLWIASIIILFIGLSILLLFNNKNIITIIKTIIVCFLKNI